MNNTIKPYLKKNVKMYYFKCYLGVDKLTGKSKYTTRRGFKTKTEAQKALVKLKDDFYNDKLQRQGKETFLDIYNLWIKQYEKNVEQSTLKKTKGIFKNYILPALGDILISKLTPLEFQKHVNNWSEQLKHARIAKSYTVNVMNFALLHGYVSSNLLTVAQVPRKRKKAFDNAEKEENFYTKEQLATFLSYLEEKNDLKLFTFFRLLAFSGMRKGEAFALHWSDINFEEMTISINKAISQGDNNKLYVKCTKSGNSRIIPIDEKTLNILKDWREAQIGTYEKLGFNTLNPEQLIFSNTKNQHIQPSVTSRWLNEIFEKCELPPITAHGFRHTHCTLLNEAKVNSKEIQQRLGHSNERTTKDIYTHVLEIGKKRSIQQFSDYMAS